VSSGASGSGYLIHTKPDGNCLSSVENVAEEDQFRLDEIFTEAAEIQVEDFGGTHNWTLSIKQSSARVRRFYLAHF
jgi:hypothetical protein